MPNLPPGLQARSSKDAGHTMAMSVRTMPKVVDFASVEATSLRVRIVTADTIDTPTHASVMPGPGNNPVRTVCCKNCIVHGMALALTSLQLSVQRTGTSSLLTTPHAPCEPEHTSASDMQAAHVYPRATVWWHVVCGRPAPCKGKPAATSTVCYCSRPGALLHMGASGLNAAGEPRRAAGVTGIVQLVQLGAQHDDGQRGREQDARAGEHLRHRCANEAQPRALRAQTRRAQTRSWDRSVRDTKKTYCLAQEVRGHASLQRARLLFHRPCDSCMPVARRRCRAIDSHDYPSGACLNARRSSHHSAKHC